ncbi:MAG: hypothetical protein QNJ20_05080 [Paracoccaceae bacterium]|nr:hypothetical protein [Paracoccaceae bacterium]
MTSLIGAIKKFAGDAAGATIVEYAVALIVVTIVGAVVLTFGDNIAGIVDATAGAF